MQRGAAPSMLLARIRRSPFRPDRAHLPSPSLFRRSSSSRFLPFNSLGRSVNIGAGAARRGHVEVSTASEHANRQARRDAAWRKPQPTKRDRQLCQHSARHCLIFPSRPRENKIKSRRTRARVSRVRSEGKRIIARARACIYYISLGESSLDVRAYRLGGAHTRVLPIPRLAEHDNGLF